MGKKLLLIDSSYFNFYRFFATKSWYLRDPNRVESSIGVEWLSNLTFMATYEKMWFETVKKLCKMFVPDQIIFARDGNDVWRYKIFPDYKGNRDNDCEEGGVNDGPGPVFKHTNENFHCKVEKSTVIRVDTAEADDIIAVAVDYYQKAIPDCEITIITGDHDMLQLCKPGVQIYNLKGKKFTNITCSNPYESKMMKILAGDPSDNIKSAFPRCGKGTAAKMIKDPNVFHEWAAKHGMEQYNLNCYLVDFRYIPKPIQQEIIQGLEKTIQIIRGNKNDINCYLKITIKMSVTLKKNE